jgi:hypothetical protein
VPLPKANYQLYFKSKKEKRRVRIAACLTVSKTEITSINRLLISQTGRQNLGKVDNWVFPYTVKTQFQRQSAFVLPHLDIADFKFAEVIMQIRSSRGRPQHRINEALTVRCPWWKEETKKSVGKEISTPTAVEHDFAILCYTCRHVVCASWHRRNSGKDRQSTALQQLRSIACIAPVQTDS